MAKGWQSKLNDFVGELERALGDNLVSATLFGDTVRGTIEDKRPEVDVLLILQDASPEALRPVGSAVAGWVKSGNPPPLIFSEREWRDSTDVFPIEVEDMREAHRVLHGSDPFEDLTTAAADLRQELEREIRGKLLQLRAEFAATEADGRALADLLATSARTFFILFRAVLRAAGQSPPQEPAAVIRAATELADTSPEAFDWVLQRLTGDKARRLKAYDPIGVRYVEAIEQLAHFVDGMMNSGDGTE